MKTKRISSLVIAIVCILLQCAVFASAADEAKYGDWSKTFPNMMRNVDIVDGQKYTTTNYVEISLCGGTVNEVRVMPRFSSSNNDAAARWVSLFQRDSKTDYTRVYLDGYMSKDTKLKIVGFQKNVSSKTGKGSLSLM